MSVANRGHQTPHRLKIRLWHPTGWTLERAQLTRYASLQGNAPFCLRAPTTPQATRDLCKRRGSLTPHNRAPRHCHRSPEPASQALSRPITSRHRAKNKASRWLARYRPIGYSVSRGSRVCYRRGFWWQSEAIGCCGWRQCRWSRPPKWSNAGSDCRWVHSGTIVSKHRVWHDNVADCHSSLTPPEIWYS